MSKTTDLPNQAEYADDCFLIPSVITLVGRPPSLIAATGERVALRKTAELQWNSTSDNASLPLTQIGNAATEKQNGEGSRLSLCKTAQSKIFLLTVRAQNAHGTFMETETGCEHVATGEWSLLGNYAETDRARHLLGVRVSGLRHR